MTSLSDFRYMFARLRRSPGAKWTEDTRRKAPHKPLFVLAVMDLVSRGAVTSRVIDIRGDLYELNELFTAYWHVAVPKLQTSSIAFPFAHLHNEPFWKLLMIDGADPTPATINSITNVVQLRRVAIGAELDDAVFELLMDAESRECLAATLLTSCFSPEVAMRLQEQRRIHSEAFDYSVALDHSVGEQTRVSDVMGPASYQPAVRSQGFRRSIVMHYDHRCALCGIRIVTPEGQTAVDAAHIVPWSVSRNDDIRNGMALCKLCHWAFDQGMMSVSTAYTVVLSRNLSADNNAAGLLGVLTGRRLVGPQTTELWPHPDNLTWHRKHYGFM